MSLITKAFYATLLKPLIRLYLRLEPVVWSGGLRVKVPRSVFHPKLYFSSGFMREFIEQLQLKNRSVLDIGCGSGILSLAAARSGAEVTALDINPAAVASTRENAMANMLSERIHVIESDVFANLPRRVFDYIIVNPPYYFRAPDSDAARAWYCGENGEFFNSFFERLNDYASAHTHIYMCLEEKVETERVREIAASHGYRMDVVDRKKMKWEVTYIFSVSRSDRNPVASG
jgi:release factor glutamine methyltransferase